MPGRMVSPECANERRPHLQLLPARPFVQPGQLGRDLTLRQQFAILQRVRPPQTPETGSPVLARARACRVVAISAWLSSRRSC